MKRIREIETNPMVFSDFSYDFSLKSYGPFLNLFRKNAVPSRHVTRDVAHFAVTVDLSYL